MGHKLTATGSLKAYIYSCTRQQAAAVLSCMFNAQSVPHPGAAMLNTGPSVYLLPDVFIMHVLQDPIDTALIQGHKLRGHQMTCAPVAVHPEL